VRRWVATVWILIFFVMVSLIGTWWRWFRNGPNHGFEHALFGILAIILIALLMFLHLEP